MHDEEIQSQQESDEHGHASHRQQTMEQNYQAGAVRDWPQVGASTMEQTEGLSWSGSTLRESMAKNLIDYFLQPEGLTTGLPIVPHRKRSKKAASAEKRLLSTAETAKYLGIGQTKLRQMVHAGEIPVIRGKYWKFDLLELDKWIQRNQEKQL